MDGGFKPISQKVFDGLENDSSRFKILFGYIHDIHSRVQTLEKRKRYDPIVIGLCAFLGGAAVVIGNGLLF